MIGKYTPAETLMILESEKTTLKLLLLLTFLDLRLKKVIELVWLSRETKDGDIRHPFVQYAENFIDYIPKPHEKVFYEPMAASTEPRMELGQLITLALEMAVSRQDYLVNYFLENAAFAKNFTAVMGGGYPLSIAGQKSSEVLSDEVSLLNELMPNYLDNSPQEAAEILLSIGGNIFLLNSVKHEKLEEFGKLIGRDRGLRYREENWYFENLRPKGIANPFHQFSSISRAFYKVFEQKR